MEEASAVKTTVAYPLSALTFTQELSVARQRTLQPCVAVVFSSAAGCAWTLRGSWGCVASSPCLGADSSLQFVQSLDLVRVKLLISSTCNHHDTFDLGTFEVCQSLCASREQLLTRGELNVFGNILAPRSLPSCTTLRCTPSALSLAKRTPFHAMSIQGKGI